jgi:hypothetical protein
VAEPAATLELVAERRTTRGRELELRLLQGDAYAAAIVAPASRSAAWRVAGDPADSAHAGARISFLAAPDSGWTVTLTVDGASPVTLETAAWRHRPTPAARDLMRRLPAWTDAYAESVVRERVTF